MVPTCLYYFKDTQMEISLTTQVALIVTLINVLMRMAIMGLVKSLQFNTRSKEISFTIIAVYLSNLLNIIVILVVTDTSMFRDFFPKQIFS